MLSLLQIAATDTPSGSKSTTIQADRESMVREYLLQHPEFVLDDEEVSEAIRRTRLAREEERVARLRRNIIESRADLIHSKLTPASGAADPGVTLIEFYDYQCLPCRQSQPAVESIRSENPDVRVVYAQLPIYGSHSVLAARAVIAAHQQNLFDAFHRALMAADLPLRSDLVYSIAETVGLNLDKLQADIGDPRIQSHLEEIDRDPWSA